MSCPHCAATTTTELTKCTQLGYRCFRCAACRRQFNERTGTPYNYLEFPTDIVVLVVVWRLRYKLSLRDLAEMFLERGFEFTHEAVREWKRALRRLWRTGSAPSARARRAAPGTSMKPTSRLPESGNTSTVPSIARAIWLTP